MVPSTEVVYGIPQRAYGIPLDKTVHPDLETLDFSRVFDRLIVGPSQYAIPMLETFAEALAKAGVAVVPQKHLCASLIPLRV